MADEPTFQTEGEVREYLEDNKNEAVVVHEPFGDATLFIDEDGALKVELVDGEVVDAKGDNHDIVSDTTVESKDVAVEAVN